jgi:uncharacterized protein (DUF2235 family)
MVRNIIVLSDGTGNSSAKLFKTNVWRTYEALDLSDPKKQIAYYDDGVGSSSIKPLALLGGAIGLGLSRNVRELYAYVCRNYEKGGNNKGDRIYGFGFSRGAFTIRILAGFITKMGLLKRGAWTDERDLQKKTTQLFRAYRKQASGDSITPFLAKIIRGVRDCLPGQVLEAGFHTSENFHLDAEIEFLGLWDTVDAYGFPIDEMTVGWDRFVWPLSMRNRDLSSKVKKAVHALSLDDERNSFHPLLWNETGSSPGSATAAPVRLKEKEKTIRQERLSQVWFCGMHANVGGGYPDDFLSFVPLNWVLRQTGAHVIFNKAKRDEYAKAARITGVMHDSRAGLGAYYRLLPRKLDKLTHTSRAIFKFEKGNMPGIGEDNVVEIDRSKIHHSVFDRITADGTGYAPIVLPGKYAVVMPDDSIIDLGAKTLETSDRAELRAQAQEKVWDLVWYRRIAYFTTLFVTLCLLFLPWAKHLTAINWIWPISALEDGDKCIKSALCFVAGVPKLIGVFLPAFADRWVATYSANPGIFLLLAAALGAMMLLGKRLDGKIQARMSTIWRNSPDLDASFSRLHDLRESRAYQWVLQSLKKHVLPAFFGLGALASIGLAAVSGTSRILFSLSDSWGAFCSVDDTVQRVTLTPTYSRRLLFLPSEDCWPTRLQAEKGATYRVVMNISETMGSWKDETLESDLLGNVEDHNFALKILGWSSKRYLWEKYYKPVARIRNKETDVTGQDEYVLNPTFLSSKKRYDCLVSDFTAQSSGELFLFVNDAIIYFQPDRWLETYGNNRGKAEVFIKRIAIAGEPFALPPEMTYTSACKEFIFTPP